MIQYLLKQLNLKQERIKNIEAFCEKSRLKPYVEIISKHPDVFNKLKKIYPNKIKDNWDCTVELYRYNIKLSKAIYPYLSILENIIKTRLSDYLKNKFGDEFYYDYELFMNLLELNEFDRKAFEICFNKKINKVTRNEILTNYQMHNKELSKKFIQKRISRIKKAISILSDAFEYRFKNNRCSFDDFVETKPTLNYWITLLEIKGLYLKNNSENELDLKPIFPNIEIEDIRTLKTIAQKLDDIRLLRNAISHYNRIICTKISKDYDLWDIYNNIIEIFHLLGCTNIDYIVGDINCCKEGSFESLYRKFEFLKNINL